MMKTDLDTFLKFIDNVGGQKYYWTVEIEGFDWTKQRKIWNEESAKATYDIEKSQADRMGRKIYLYKITDNKKELFLFA